MIVKPLLDEEHGCQFEEEEEEDGWLTELKKEEERNIKIQETMNLLCGFLLCTLIITILSLLIYVLIITETKNK